MCSQQLNPGDIMAICRTHGGTRTIRHKMTCLPSPPPPFPSSSHPLVFSPLPHLPPFCHQSQLMKTAVRYITCMLGSPCMFVSCLQQKSPSTPRVKTHSLLTTDSLTQIITTSHPCSWVPGQRLALLKATKSWAKA